MKRRTDKKGEISFFEAPAILLTWGQPAGDDNEGASSSGKGGEGGGEVGE